MTDLDNAPALLILDDASLAAETVGRRIASALSRDPATVLGLATGNTMRPVYAWLVQSYRRREITFHRATSFNLDEYVGLPPGHSASFARFMQEHLFGQVDCDPRRAHLLNGLAPDLTAEAARFEAAISAAGGIGLQLLGIGLQLLGIGRNGHIGFNEPGAAFTSTTRAVTLTPSTRAANLQSFPAGETVPDRALTLGIGTILRAREIVLLATSPSKASAVAAAFAGSISPHCPASALRLHGAVTLVCDRAAAAGLDPTAFPRSAQPP